MLLDPLRAIKAEHVCRAGVWVVVVVADRTDNGDISGDGHGEAELIPIGVIGCQQLLFLDPPRAVEAEDIRRAGEGTGIGVPDCADHHSLAGDVHRPAEQIRRGAVGGLQFGFLNPIRAVVTIHVCRAGVVVVKPSADHGGVAGDRNRVAKSVTFQSIGGKKLSGLTLAQGRGQPGSDVQCTDRSQDNEH